MMFKRQKTWPKFTICWLLAGIAVLCGLQTTALHHGDHTASNFLDITSFPHFIDLSHRLMNSTLHWPRNAGFTRYIEVEKDQVLSNGEKQFIFSDDIKMATHTGTHLDAPRHFGKESWTVDQIPISRLAEVPVVVVDVSAKVLQNNTYSFTKDDVKAAKPKSVLFVYTGISELYDGGAESYLGTSSTNITLLRVPGFSPEAATFLAKDVGVYGVGIDSISIDSSARHLDESSGDLVSHRIFSANNVYMIENVHKNLKLLLHTPPNTLTTVAINPLPIVNGSGSPLRLVARIARDTDNTHSGSLALTISFYSVATLVITSLLAFTCL